MKLTAVNKNYKSQSLILPFVGLVALDENGSFECPDKFADQVLKHSSVLFESPGLFLQSIIGSSTGTLQETKPLEVKPKKLTRKQQQELEKQAKLKGEQFEQEIEKEALVGAINEASLEELQEIAKMVPGATSPGGNFVQPITEDALRAFLLDKLNKATLEQA